MLITVARAQITSDSHDGNVRQIQWKALSNLLNKLSWPFAAIGNACTYLKGNPKPRDALLVGGMQIEEAFAMHDLPKFDSPIANERCDGDLCVTQLSSRYLDTILAS